MKDKKRCVLFLSHGGGPLPLLGDQGHREMVENLKHIATRIKRPAAIVVISAHWEEKIPTVTSAAEPSLIYDYSGFPKASYELEYPCPGEPQLAAQIHRRLNDAGINAGLDESRGLDHGVFVPLTIMYPAADIPCVQLSLVQGLDPAQHIKIGKAVSALDMDDLLIIGSGFSFHNMRAFFTADSSESRAMNVAFEQWLIETCSDTRLSEEQRALRLANWQQAPAARYCHPREEHLMPLHVCYGIAQTACSEHYELSIMNKKSSVYLW